MAIDTALQHMLQAAQQGQPLTEEALVPLLQQLISHDFEALVRLLYRIDVPEKTLKQSLAQQPQQDAALIIARLILQRLQQKQQWRQQFTQQHDIPEDEKW